MKKSMSVPNLKTLSASPMKRNCSVQAFTDQMEIPSYIPVNKIAICNVVKFISNDNSKEAIASCLAAPDYETDEIKAMNSDALKNYSRFFENESMQERYYQMFRRIRIFRKKI